MRTVRRRSLESRSLWGRVSQARSYRLDNYFNGQDVAVEAVRDDYFAKASIGNTPRIWFNPEKATYTVHYHSNHWIELS
jgi:hypothetical protein